MRHTFPRITAIGLLLTLAAGSAAAQGALAPPAAFPNPHVAGRLTVPYDGAAEEAPALEVFDVLGRQVTPASALPAGTYLLRLRYADGRVTGAGRLTKLADGPLEVLLQPATQPETPASAPTAHGEAEAADCAGPAWEGLRRVPLGAAQINLTPGGDLALTGIGASGADGLRACLGRATGAGLRFTPLDLLQRDLSAEWTLRGRGPQGTGPLATVRFHNDSVLDLEVDLTRTGARSMVLEVWDDTDVVHTVTVPMATFKVEIEGVTQGAFLKEAFGGLTVGQLGESAPNLLHVGSVAFQDPVVVHFRDHDFIGDRLVFRAPLPAAYFATEDLWRFANTGDLVLEDAVVGAMGHFHSIPDALDPRSFLLDAAAPAGPLAVACLPGGCPPEVGVQVRVPPARERLRLDLQPVTIPSGGSSHLSVGLDWSASDGQGPGEALTLEVRGGLSGGIILQMDKEFCDEATASDECDVRLEYWRNGRVMAVQTLRAGVPLRLPGSLRVRSVEGVVVPDEAEEDRKPITWAMQLGVNFRGGQEQFRFSGSGPAPAVLDGLTLLTNQPLRIESEQSCPGWPGCGAGASGAALLSAPEQLRSPFE